MNRRRLLQQTFVLTSLPMLLAGCVAIPGSAPAPTPAPTPTSAPAPTFTPVPTSASVPTSAPELIKIGTPNEVKEAIESYTPGQEYGYYVLRAVSPKQAEDLTGMTLLMCGDIEPPEAGLMVAISSIAAIGKPLFKGTKAYSIGEVGCSGLDPCVIGGGDISLSSVGADISFRQDTQTYGSQVSDEALLANCITAMQQDPATVFLMKKGAVVPGNEIVELAFK